MTLTPRTRDDSPRPKPDQSLCLFLSARFRDISAEIIVSSLGKKTGWRVATAACLRLSSSAEICDEKATTLWTNNATSSAQRRQIATIPFYTAQRKAAQRLKAVPRMIESYRRRRPAPRGRGACALTLSRR
ncbi:hypothetical protein THAOC_17891 [Thalassiosira oceanica]|uniref:Uncharacterized protein n=1 Tax=Thalassiosira oceanica TaxID=159749 RepID=K0S9K3_THAOC|nr:hypothetical protein THAOC_17891 [Thalassiosira oceanica]|eukprot:EJK61594.1 hypothetical protein THAOC_17891 [Thalassiosira oceanica]